MWMPKPVTLTHARCHGRNVSIRNSVSMASRTICPACDADRVGVPAGEDVGTVAGGPSLVLSPGRGDPASTQSEASSLLMALQAIGWHGSAVERAPGRSA